MSKARGQSATRRNKRITQGFQSEYPNSTKTAKCSSTSSTVMRKNKYVVQLSKKEILRRENLAKRKLKLAS